MFLISAFMALNEPYGRISYNGRVVELSSGSAKVSVDEKGVPLPYGMYNLKLANGKTLLIHKNNRGNAAVTEQDGVVIVRADANVIDVRTEK